jgi:hypothetical protein
MSEPSRPRPVPGPPAGAAPRPVPAEPAEARTAADATATDPTATDPTATEPTAAGSAPAPFADLDQRPVTEHVDVYEAEHARLERELRTIDQL